MTIDRFEWKRPPILASAAFVGVGLVLAICAASYRSAIVDLQHQFETKSRILAGLERQSALSPEAAGNEGKADSLSEAISAPTGTLAASEIQTNMVNLIEQAGGILHSVQAQVTSDSGGDGLRRLKAQVIFDASNEALQKVLYRLETGKPYSFVDSLIVQPTQSAGSAKLSWDALRVTLDASNYWRGNGKPEEDSQTAVVR
jgi:general secretion pathway protein M